MESSEDNSLFSMNIFTFIVHEIGYFPRIFTENSESFWLFSMKSFCF